MKIRMLRWIRLGLLVCAGLGLSGRSLPAEDKHAEKNDGLSVTVAFGAGLNTLPIVEPLAPNNHILPPEIKVRQGGVVHFLMSGFHMAPVYNPGTEPENIVVPPSGTFINDPTAVPPSNVFYFGINPQGGPLNTPATTNPLQWFQSARVGLFFRARDISGDLQCEATFPRRNVRPGEGSAARRTTRRRSLAPVM